MQESPESARAAATAPERPDARINAKALLAVLFGTAFIAAFNENIVNVGLPDIMATFSITSAQAQWMVTGYMIVGTIIVAVVAFLQKRFTLRQLFFAGALILLCGSVADMLAPTWPLLLAARLFQAIGTGIFIPTMMATVLALAPRKKLGTYLAIGSCCITFGPAFGPVASGVMVTFFGWRTMFLVPAVAMAVLLVLGAVFVKPLGPAQKVKCDLPSVALAAVGLTLFVYGLAQITADLPVALACLAVSVALIAAFTVRQGKLEVPVLNMEPMRRPSFSIACILVIVAMMSTFSMSVLLPLYFEGALGTTALVAGVLVLVPILFNAATALIGGRAMDKRGEWPLLPVGFLLIAIGMVAVSSVAASLSMPAVVAAACAIYAGVGLVMSPSQTAGLKRLPRELNGYGVGIMNMFIQMAAAIGPSLFVGVLSSTVAVQTAAGASSALAEAAGFADAAHVAAAIAAAGFVVAFAYARSAAKGDTAVGAKQAGGERANASDTAAAQTGTDGAANEAAAVGDENAATASGEAGNRARAQLGAAIPAAAPSHAASAAPDSAGAPAAARLATTSNAPASGKAPEPAAGASASRASAPSEDRFPAVSGEGFTLSRIMKADAYTVRADEPVYKAVEQMLAHHTSGLPVVDGTGAVVGFVSDGDIMKSLADTDTDLRGLTDLTYSMSVFANDEAFDSRLDKLMNANVMDVATPDVVSIDADAPIEQVCTVLGRSRIKKAPVLRRGKLVGTVSRNDVNRALMANFLQKKPE